MCAQSSERVRISWMRTLPPTVQLWIVLTNDDARVWPAGNVQYVAMHLLVRLKSFDTYHILLLSLHNRRHDDQIAGRRKIAMLPLRTVNHCVYC